MLIFICVSLIAQKNNYRVDNMQQQKDYLVSLCESRIRYNNQLKEHVLELDDDDYTQFMSETYHKDFASLIGNKESYAEILDNDIEQYQEVIDSIFSNNEFNVLHMYFYFDTISRKSELTKITYDLYAKDPLKFESSKDNDIYE